MMFKIGDLVQPRPEWRDDPNDIPSGRVRAVVVWGTHGALYVGDGRRAFAAHVFDFSQEPGP